MAKLTMLAKKDFDPAAVEGDNYYLIRSAYHHYELFYISPNFDNLQINLNWIGIKDSDLSGNEEEIFKNVHAKINVSDVPRHLHILLRALSVNEKLSPENIASIQKSENPFIQMLYRIVTLDIHHLTLVALSSVKQLLGKHIMQPHLETEQLVFFDFLLNEINQQRGNDLLLYLNSLAAFEIKNGSVYLTPYLTRFKTIYFNYLCRIKDNASAVKKVLCNIRKLEYVVRAYNDALESLNATDIVTQRTALRNFLYAKHEYEKAFIEYYTLKKFLHYFVVPACILLACMFGMLLGGTVGFFICNVIPGMGLVGAIAGSVVGGVLMAGITYDKLNSIYNFEESEVLKFSKGLDTSIRDFFKKPKENKSVVTNQSQHTERSFLLTT